MHFPVSGRRQSSHDRIHWFKRFSFWLMRLAFLTMMPAHSLNWQMWGITEIKLTSAPFTYLNKITIHFIAERGKESSPKYEIDPQFELRYRERLGERLAWSSVDVMNIYLGHQLLPPSLPPNSTVNYHNEYQKYFTSWAGRSQIMLGNDSKALTFIWIFFHCLTCFYLLN